jgi:hypothetical protein
MGADDILGFRLRFGRFRLNVTCFLAGLRHRHLSQGMLQHLVNPFHWNNRQLVFDVLRNFGEILVGFVGDQDRADAAAMGCQQLLFEAADRLYLATQGDLTGHGHIALDRHVG